MRLATFTHDGSTRSGVVVEDHVVDLAVAAPGLPSDLNAILAAGDDALDRAATAGTGTVGVLPLADVRLEAPVRPRKFLVVGRNYRTYRPKTEAAPDDEVTKVMLARKLKHKLDIDGLQAAGHQVWVGKEATALTGPFDPILLPKVSPHVIYENELAIVIGKRCHYVSRDEALDVIGGYLICNDVTFDRLRRVLADLHAEQVVRHLRADRSVARHQG